MLREFSYTARDVKLHYFKDPQGNFGDDLNPWLWPRVAPGLLDDDGRELFVGIGTLLNHRLPSAPIKHVFGSGYGYGAPPRTDERWLFHAVRGHETARLLGVPRERVITDAAVLLRAIELPHAPRTDRRVGFMPHCQSSRDYNWSAIADELGWHYIDAGWTVERVLTEMTRCETMVCEAMHGAIVADTLRIPWIPVACYEHISTFKWRDWLSTLELPYAPQRVPSLFDTERSLGMVARTKNIIKRSLARTGLQAPAWTPAPPAKTGPALRERAVVSLATAARGRAYLSDDRIVERHLQRYLECLHRLQRQPNGATPLPLEKQALLHALPV
jgi:succinoglycan biosynthesis protein ExoV